MGKLLKYKKRTTLIILVSIMFNVSQKISDMASNIYNKLDI